MNKLEYNVSKVSDMIKLLRGFVYNNSDKPLRLVLAHGDQIAGHSLTYADTIGLLDECLQGMLDFYKSELNEPTLTDFVVEQTFVDIDSVDDIIK